MNRLSQTLDHFPLPIFRGRPLRWSPRWRAWATILLVALLPAIPGTMLLTVTVPRLGAHAPLRPVIEPVVEEPAAPAAPAPAASPAPVTIRLEGLVIQATVPHKAHSRR
jgi:hypothetical protein